MQGGKRHARRISSGCIHLSIGRGGGGGMTSADFLGAESVKKRKRKGVTGENFKEKGLFGENGDYICNTVRYIQGGGGTKKTTE